MLKEGGRNKRGEAENLRSAKKQGRLSLESRPGVNFGKNPNGPTNTGPEIFRNIPV